MCVWDMQKNSLIFNNTQQTYILLRIPLFLLVFVSFCNLALLTCVRWIFQLHSPNPRIEHHPILWLFYMMLRESPWISFAAGQQATPGKVFPCGGYISTDDMTVNVWNWWSCNRWESYGKIYLTILQLCTHRGFNECITHDAIFDTFLWIHRIARVPNIAEIKWNCLSYHPNIK